MCVIFFYQCNHINDIGNQALTSSRTTQPPSFPGAFQDDCVDTHTGGTNFMFLLMINDVSQSQLEVAQVQKEGLSH